MRIAVIADIHGNIHALESILDDLRIWAPDITIAAGDLTFKYADSLAVLEALSTIDHIALRGNADERVIHASGASPSENEHPIMSLARYTGAQVGSEWLDYLMNLPEHTYLSVRGTNDVCIAHGVPGETGRTIGSSNEREEYLEQHPDEEWPSRILRPEEVRTALNKAGSTLFISAHSHTQFYRHIEKTDIANPGAVTGQHVYREGVLMAEYMICELAPKRNVWRFIFRQLPYDHEAAVQSVRELEGECPEGIAWALNEIVDTK
jgi:predicted phosphodiesterase